MHKAQLFLIVATILTVFGLYSVAIGHIVAAVCTPPSSSISVNSSGQSNSTIAGINSSNCGGNFNAIIGIVIGILGGFAVYLALPFV